MSSSSTVIQCVILQVHHRSPGTLGSRAFMDYPCCPASNGTRTFHRWGGVCLDTGRQSRQWDRICRLFQNPQARVPEPRTQTADSTRRSTTEVPVRSRSPTSPGPGDTFSGGSLDYKCPLVTVSGLKEVPAHQLPGNCWWTCTSDEIKMIKQRRV